MNSITAGEVGLCWFLRSRVWPATKPIGIFCCELQVLPTLLILDEDGIYDVSDGNERLLLGFKGAIGEFELHGMAAGMLGGKLSTASRGELKIPLPIGFGYDHSDQVTLNLDRAIVDAVRLVLDAFRRHKWFAAVQRWMHRQNLLLPSRPSHDE